MRQVVVDAREFEAAVKTAAAVVMKRSVIASLEQVSMVVSGGSCRLMGTDLCQWVEIKVLLKSCGEDFSVIFGDTTKILRACKYYNGDLQISYEASKEQPLTFSCGELQMECEIIDEDYPGLPTGDYTETYEVVASDLYKRTEKMKYAVATNDVRPALMGVIIQNNMIYCVDGYRMAASRMDNLSVSRAISVPLSAMLRLSIYGDETIDFHCGRRFASFVNDHATIVTHLLEGEVIDPDKVVPATFGYSFPLELAGCTQGVKYLWDISGKRCNHVEFHAGVLKMGTKRGSYSAVLPIQGNPQIHFAANPVHLLEALSQFKGAKTVELRANDSSVSPLVITDGGDSYALILPRRLNAAAAA